MRTPPLLLSLALCFCLVAGTAHAIEIETADNEQRLSTAGMASRYLPAPAAHRVIASLPIELPLRWASMLRAYSDTRILPDLIEFRLRTLGDSEPPDPRHRLSSGDVVLRLPLSDTVDLRPGLRLDYAQHPTRDLWTGDPTPTLSIGMRF